MTSVEDVAARASMKTKVAIELSLWHLCHPNVGTRRFLPAGGLDPNQLPTAEDDGPNDPTLGPVRVVVYTDFPSLMGPLQQVC